MANQWFKFYGAEYLSDPKMDRLTSQERSCWITLLCMASQSEGVIRFLSLEGLLNKSGINFNPYDSTEWDNTKNVLQNFEQYEMIKINKNGVIEILNWEKRQEHNLTVAERVAKSRALKKSVTNDVTNVTTEENRIEENRIDNKKKTKTSLVNDKSFSKEGAEVVKEFESLNPASKKFYNNKTQRKACEDLISNYGLERVILVVSKTLPKTNGLQFFPTITTPLQLQDKWIALESAIRKYQSEKQIKNKVAF